MGRGRKALAHEVKEDSGAYAKNPQRRPKKTIKAASERPSVPDLISSCAVATEIWHETCELLEGMEILSKTDTHLLSQYVFAYAEWRKCAIHVQNNGVSNDDGRATAESVALFKFADRVNKLIPELGLSPSSRASLSPKLHGTQTKADREESPLSLDSIAEAMKRARTG